MFHEALYLWMYRLSLVKYLSRRKVSRTNVLDRHEAHSVRSTVHLFHTLGRDLDGHAKTNWVRGRFTETSALHCVRSVFLSCAVVSGDFFFWRQKGLKLTHPSPSIIYVKYIWSKFYFVIHCSSAILLCALYGGASQVGFGGLKMRGFGKDG
jgi:hypothetical protein